MDNLSDKMMDVTVSIGMDNEGQNANVVTKNIHDGKANTINGNSTSPSVTNKDKSASIVDALDGIAGSIRTSLSSPAEDLSAHFLLDPDQRMGIPFALVLIARGLRELAEAIRGIKK